eukprot:gene42157-63839_t
MSAPVCPPATEAEFDVLLRIIMWWARDLQRTPARVVVCGGMPPGEARRAPPPDARGGFGVGAAAAAPARSAWAPIRVVSPAA